MGLKSGIHTRRHRDRVNFFCNNSLLGIEYQYVMDIVASEENKMSLDEILELPFYEIENIKMVHDIISRGKLASQLDNKPKES